MSSEDMSQFLVDLNIFTNCTEKHSDDASLIKSTVGSLLNIFSYNHINNIRFFVDPQPRPEQLNKYVDHVAKEFPENNGIFVTNGLADGYIKSTHVCETDYIFQVEHDWEFLKTIRHNLGFLVRCMDTANIEHLRFNQRSNINLNETLTEIDVNGCKFCETTKRSNNPHIINRKSYLEKWNEKIDLSNTPKRADGIENKMIGVSGHIYGRFGYPAQIRHIDGRN